MNAVDRFLSSPLPSRQNALALCGRRAGEGVDMADDMPMVHTNDAALSLFRDALGEMRDARKDVGTIKEALARMEGQNLPGQVSAQAAALKALEKDVAALKAAGVTAAAVRKPWVTIAVDVGKMLLSAIVAAALAVVGLTGHH